MKHLAARIEIQLLMQITARAFGMRPERVWTRSHADALAAYAGCTREWMLHCTKSPEALQADMHREALRMGKLLHRLLFFLNDSGRTRLVFALYRGIGITMCGELPGEIEVRACFFSRYYTPEMCALISAMDDGIVSGIMGGGMLRFSQRITEGCGCCRACLARSRTR